MLSEEEKKAIEDLNSFKSISILYGNKFVMFLEQLKKYQRATDTVLNLITKLQKENEELKEIKNIADTKITDLRKIKDYDKLQSEIWILQNKKLKEKEKQIDEIALYFNTGLSMCEDCEKCFEFKDIYAGCKECIKQYFENKVKEEGEKK